MKSAPFRPGLPVPACCENGEVRFVPFSSDTDSSVTGQYRCTCGKVTEITEQRHARNVITVIDG